MTVKEAIAEIQLVFPDAATDVVLSCLRQVHAELCAEYPIDRIEKTVQLIAGTREYLLDSDVSAVRAAYYATSADSGYPLRATSVSCLDRSNPGWRWSGAALAGAPVEFYLDGGYIGFVPVPSDGTVGGYPVVRLACTRTVPLELGGTLPAEIGQYDAYIDGACYRLAKHLAKDQIGLWKSLFDEAQRNLERRLGGRNRLAREGFYPSHGGGVRQV